MFKKFSLLPCVPPFTENNSNEGYVIGLCSYDEPNIVLYFPIQEEDANLVNFLLDPEENKESKFNTKMLGLYQTMKDGFESSGTFVSGVSLGFEISESEDILSCQLYFSRVDGGFLESVMKTSFSNAIVFSALNDIDVFLTQPLFEKIIGNTDLEPKKESDPKDPKDPKDLKDSKLDNSKKFPLDKKISKIAKNIMNGKIKK